MQQYNKFDISTSLIPVRVTSRVCTLVQHSGKGRWGFLWEVPTLTLDRSELIVPSDIKICTID